MLALMAFNFLSWGQALFLGFAMHTTLTQNQRIMLRLIADGSLPATSEIVRDLLALLAFRLIEPTPAGKWQIINLGEAVLERQKH